LQIIHAPFLSLIPPEGGLYSLVWTPLAGAVDYLEEALDPAFATAGVIYTGSSGKKTIYGRPAGDYYYRLRRKVGALSSDYSNGVGLRAEAAAGWQVNPVDEYRNQAMLDVHAALLRLCATRGDMFAVLALPSHYRERDATAHTAQLKVALGQAEQAAYSFGGIYHPWLTGREEDDLTVLRSNPPDGAACGIMAMRSANRGAWVAPANQPLHGVVALTPTLSPAYWQALQDAQVNLVRQEPAGFLWLSASTLSDDPDLSPINVRRLMSFLRKTFIRAGVDFVFEPNSNQFRRSVQRGFERVLDKLFLFGAFAGRTARDAFQVATDSRVNTPSTLTRGQFFVEVRVAPSVPMRFLTVRLVQTADRTFVTEGP
jgi:phage tail sheath protein FI